MDKQKNSKFRTRQAPSPTGYLHLGTARQILFTQLFAMINHGIWYLRIEDTDRQRLQRESVTNLLDTLDRLTLQPDEGVVEVAKTNGRPEFFEDDFYGVFQKGQLGPYIQSERLDLYHKYAQELINKKLAYWSYLTPIDKEDLQNLKKVTKKPIDYYLENILRHPKFAKSKKNPETLKKEAENEVEYLFANVEKILTSKQKPALMYRLQRAENFECFDELLGQTSFDLSLEEDFVILKSDGYPTYHLAHLVDDHLMQTSLVLRAQEWYPSIAKHQVMFSDFWGKDQIPKYLHLPLILGETGNKKLSKRDGNVNMAGYLDQGFLPESIVNYLAFLGWSPGTDKELYLSQEDVQKFPQPIRVTRIIENIAKDFSIQTISKSPARFGSKN
ncbi:hypothetical protein HC766_02005 [Candidatus Gracilibacteria bacterium]|nr:hypothetical protein [Candidatus Gracilibacteria bacterium]